MLVAMAEKIVRVLALAQVAQTVSMELPGQMAVAVVAEETQRMAPAAELVPSLPEPSVPAVVVAVVVTRVQPAVVVVACTVAAVVAVGGTPQVAMAPQVSA